MTQHTPGKWIVDAPDNDDFGPAQSDGSKPILRLYISHNVTGGRIGAVFCNCLVTSEGELFANAALFAAAPQMLEALREFMEDDDVRALIGNGACERMDALIAAATGTPT